VYYGRLGAHHSCLTDLCCQSVDSLSCYHQQDAAGPVSPDVRTTFGRITLQPPSVAPSPSPSGSAGPSAPASPYTFPGLGPADGGPLGFELGTSNDPATATKGTSADATATLPGRARGEMVGIIHSAEIHHLTIKIKTESGDYLSLTVSYLVCCCLMLGV
jgi:hypothetical protein